MDEVIFENTGFEDLFYWAKNDRKILSKIIVLIADIRKHPYEGLGKPEALKYDFAGYWSRRITQEHRLVYKMDEEDNVVVFQCRFHYSK